MKARLWLIMGVAAACLAGPARADGPWSIEPRLGLESDYTSNPLLRESGAQGEEHVAAIVDLPLRYDTDELEFSLRPNGRITNSQGYSSLASNYEHIDASAQYLDALDSASLVGEVARDSSLYFLGGLVNRVGVARDSESTNFDWTRITSALTKLQLDAGWNEVRYKEPPQFDELVNYRYWSAGPTLSYQTSERDTVKLIGNYGAYNSLDGITQSRSENVQLGFVRQLTEIWTLSTSAGYSRSQNSEKVYFFGIIYLGTEKSNQKSAVYSATVNRQGERFGFSAGATQALQPTGFAYLSRQDSVNITSTYTRSERWDFALGATWLKAINPELTNTQGAVTSRDLTIHYLNAQFTANFHWTPQWIVSVTATRITQQYGPPTVSAASSGISVNFSRQFHRMQF